MRHRIHRVVLFLAFTSTLLGQAPAAPTPPGSRTELLHRRQANGAPPTQPIVTQTEQTIDTNSGPVTETCTLTFTPVTGPNGEPLVQVVRQCTQVPGAGTQPPSTTTTTSSSSSSTPPSTTTTSTSTSTSGTSSTTSSQSTSTTSTSSTTSSRSTSTTSTSSTTSSQSTSMSSTSTTSSSTSTTSVVANTGVSVVGLSSIPQPTTTQTPPPSVATTSSSSSSSSVSSSSSSNGGSPVTAADNTSTSPSSTAQSAFSIPGRKISVLPIGLGIFAGISVIALIVVGLVTYERTKYRKIFRQRRLAEQGQGMGYS
ncbi:hypothetical protein BC826DRAFT_998440 [Russula brevipes]|nr:hypothetical protein BC826DRAFT_998440 [Russula brevipes]